MKKNYIIAIVDDEEDIVELISHNLLKEKYKVKKFYDGEKFLNFIENNKIDLLILDLMLPGVDGLDICKWIRNDEKTKSLPIIMLTAKDTEIDKVVGLEIGADDYITKPFSIRELMARIKSIFRRISNIDNNSEKKIINIGELSLNPATYEVFINNEKVDLTITEFRVLMILIKVPGRVFRRMDLLDKLWGMDKIVIDRTIDVHIVKLRKKLKKYGENIKSIRGIGYKFEED